MLQKFGRSEDRNIKFFKIRFVSGDDGITADGPGAGSYEAVLKVPCFLLKCGEDIVVSNAAHLNDFQNLPDSFVCEVSAVGVFPYQIVDVGDGGSGDKTVNFVFFTETQNFAGIFDERFPFQQHVDDDVGITHDFHILTAAPLVKNPNQCRKGHL